MRQTQAERDRRDLKRRLEVLKLPVVALKRHGYVKPTDLSQWQSEPEAVGVGPDGTAFAVWAHRGTAGRKQVTEHLDGSDIVTAVEVQTDLRVWFVQPLPGGRLLLTAARSDGYNAEVWSEDGKLLRAGDLGDAIEFLLTTPSGGVWVGYFDEAIGASGPAGHGLARFTENLEVDWLYPFDAGLPSIDDCYNLNVDGENAYCCPYMDFHLISVVRDKVTDLGLAPHPGANALLIRGGEGALIGGYSSEYDLVTPLRLSREGVELRGPQYRIVLPDGTEAHHVRYTSRGADLHAFTRGTWYRATLDDLFDATTKK